MLRTHEIDILYRYNTISHKYAIRYINVFLNRKINNIICILLEHILYITEPQPMLYITWLSAIKDAF